jgi:hypothetical protein
VFDCENVCISRVSAPSHEDCCTTERGEDVINIHECQRRGEEEVQRRDGRNRAVGYNSWPSRAALSHDGIRHQASGLRHQVSGVRSQASGWLWLLGAGWLAGWLLVLRTGRKRPPICICCILTLHTLANLHTVVRRYFRRSEKMRSRGACSGRLASVHLA